MSRGSKQLQIPAHRRRRPPEHKHRTLVGLLKLSGPAASAAQQPLLWKFLRGLLGPELSGGHGRGGLTSSRRVKVRRGQGGEVGMEGVPKLTERQKGEA